MAFRVGKDNDGVIYNSLVPVCADANRIIRERGYDFFYRPGNFRTFSFLYDDVLRRTGDEKLAREVENLWYSEGTLRRARPYRGAVTTANLTWVMGGDQYVITSRPPHLRDITIGSFREEIPVITPDRVRIRDSNDPRSGDEFKRDNVIEVRPVVYFEDNTKTFRYLLTNRERFPRMRLCLVDQPWNKDAFDLDSYRVYGQLGILAATIAAGLCYSGCGYG